MTAPRSTLAAVAALAAVYAAVIAAGSTMAWSGSDAGGRAATVKVMAESGSWSPDVGYWAAGSDPDGRFHPLVNTSRVGDQWVQATSLPFVYAAVPLYEASGFAGVLALPVAGALLAAVAARRLARAMGAARGWGAFWLVGLGSPAAFYAGDLWEHAPAVGLGLLAAALLVEPGGWPRALAGGLAAGAGVVLRTEVLVYAATFGIAVVAVPPLREGWLRRPGRLAAAGAGLALPLLANEALERAVVDGALRSGRAGAQVAEAGAELGARLSDGLLTTVALFPESTARSELAGAVVVLGVAVVAAAAVALVRAAVGRAAAALLLAVLVVRVADGLGFVPGALVAAPAAAAGFLVGVPAVGRSLAPAARAVALAAVLAIPVVWAFQWRGLLVPQWGGRYLLLSGALLTIVGAAVLEPAGWRRWPAGAVVAAALVMGAFGAAWHAERTGAMAALGEAIERAPADVVLVTDVHHLPRELGAWYGDHRWLAAPGRRQLPGAVAVARAEGARRVEVVQLDEGGEAPTFPGYRLVGEREAKFRSFPFVIRRYDAR